MPEMRAKGVTSATVRQVIVRACTECGGKREIGVPCADCGNEQPPVTHDLGIQSFYHSNRIKQLLWDVYGSRLAAARANEANKEVTGGNDS